MMNDEQRASEVLASVGDSATVNRPEGSGVPTPEAEAKALEAAQADGETTDLQDGEAEGTKSRWSFLTEMVVLFAVALAIALLIKTFVMQPFFIPSGSMENTLLIGDKVLVNKIVYRIRPISRGDIVVFNGEGSWLAPSRTPPSSRNPLVRLYDVTLGPLFSSIKGLFGTAPGQTDYIKRVIGIPGDHVVCCNAKGQITVNGIALHEKPYLIPGARSSQGTFNIVVPPGRIWVMGDNRPESADSRLHDCGYTYTPATCVPYDRNGTVPEDKVIGRAFMIVWPPSRIRILPIPQTFTQTGLDGSSAMPARADRSALTGALQVRPSASYLPLAGGLIAVVPLTLLERRIRRRARRRRRSLAHGARPRPGPRRG